MWCGELNWIVLDRVRFKWQVLMLQALSYSINICTILGETCFTFLFLCIMLNVIHHLINGPYCRHIGRSIRYCNVLVCRNWHHYFLSYSANLILKILYRQFVINTDNYICMYEVKVKCMQNKTGRFNNVLHIPYSL